jgi:hypothetical protein
MKVAVSGCLRTPLAQPSIPALREGGSRHRSGWFAGAARTPDEVSMGTQPQAPSTPGLLQGVEAAVHLSGASIGGRPVDAVVQAPCSGQPRHQAPAVSATPWARLEPEATRPRLRLRRGLLPLTQTSRRMNQSAGGTGFPC